MKAKGRSGWVAVWLAALIGVAFALFVDLRAVAAQLRAADWRYLAAASAALLAGIGVYAWRWRWLMGNEPGWWRTFHAANVGHGLNLLLPFRVGEAARIVVLGRSGQPPMAKVAASVVVERLLEQIMRLGALGGALVFGLGLKVSPLAGAGAVGFLAAAFGALVWLRHNHARVLAWAPAALGRLPRVDEGRVRQGLSSLLDGLAAAGAPGRVAVALGLSAVLWACYWAFGALALRALPGAAHLASLLPLSLGALALAPASAPAQAGIYHAALVVPLSLVGFGETLVTAYAVVLHALLMIWMLSLGLWALARSGVPASALVSRKTY
jgi:hypothetical protein